MRIKTFLSAALCVSDRLCDYVPLLSALTNTVDLAAKAVLSRKSEATSKDRIPDPNEVKKDNLYKEHLKVKSIKRCLIASVPVAGNGGVLIYDIGKGLIKFTEFCIKQYKQSRTITGIGSAEEESEPTTSRVDSSTSSVGGSTQSDSATPNDGSSGEIEVSKENPIPQEPIEEEDKIPKIKRAINFFEEDLQKNFRNINLNIKLISTESIEDKSDETGDRIIQETFELSARYEKNHKFVLTTRDHSSRDGKPVLALSLEHITNHNHRNDDDDFFLEHQEYFQFLMAEGLIGLPDSSGIANNSFQVLCHTKEQKELAVRMISLFVAQEQLSLPRRMLLTLNGAQLQMVVLRNLCKENSDIIFDMLWELSNTQNRQGVTTNAENPFFMEFIKKFSKHNSNIDSLKLIQAWLASPMPIAHEARKQICLTAIDFLVKLMRGKEDPWSLDRALELVNIVRLTKLDFGPAQEKAPLLFSIIVDFNSLSKEQALQVLARLYNAALNDNESSTNFHFWRSLATPLIQLVNEEVMNDNERHYPPEMLVTHEGRMQTSVFLFHSL